MAEFEQPVLFDFAATKTDSGIRVPEPSGKTPPGRTDPNPMVKAHGYGPEGAKCKTCKHLYAKLFDKTYYKCSFRRNTNGAGSDHRMRWNACARYEARPEGEEIETHFAG